MLWPGRWKKKDPEGLMDFPVDYLKSMENLVQENDGPFKSALDRYKYPNRYDGVDAVEQRDLGAQFIAKLNTALEGQIYLFGNRISKADIAILPFVRQFAHVDRDWFWGENWPNVLRWLEAFLESDRFAAIMKKYPEWVIDEQSVEFGG